MTQFLKLLSTGEMV